MEQGLTKQQLISELTRSPHRELMQFHKTGFKAAVEDAEFFGHLIAWNHKNGQVRDAQTALPVIALAARPAHRELVENALAHVVDLDPRNMLRAWKFAREVKAPVRVMRRVIERYLHDLEAARPVWERVVLQHRQSIIALYARRDLRIKPAPWADNILFKGQVFYPGSVFQVVRDLKNMSPLEGAAAVLKYRIPFLVALPALGEKIKDVDAGLAIIRAASATELVTNVALFERMGVKTVPALRAAFEDALQKAQTSKKATLKTGKRAAEINDEGLSKKLNALQEKQLDNLSQVEGDWLVLGDKSSSMRVSIEKAREVAAFLARMAKGKVHLVFFDTMPRYLDATGKTLEELTVATRMITAGGMTSIGCGLQIMVERGLNVDGIAIVSDGGENSVPLFAQVYKRYVEKLEKEIPVYFYHVPGDADSLTDRCQSAGVDIQKFELQSSVDHYSLPNLVQTMRTNRYGLVDKIMETRLQTLDQILTRTKGMEVIGHARTAASV